MKKVLLSGLLLFSSLFADQKNDQLHVLFGASGYVLYKALDFANDHGFRYIKILSYEFKGFDHTLSGKYEGDRNQGGRYFELKDEYCHVSLLCLDESSKDPSAIDLENYRSLLDRVLGE